ncbi:MAG TPA: DNA repair protein RecO [Polyangiaceae bacterium]|jgi:DNA repair protein RecO (recombination protein O)|nr:DNA repair protein RecO [Polyangiaceae bacterium]
MPRALRAKAERLQTEALLVRRVSVGESDLVLTFFTEARGLIAAAARAARRSWKRFSALEPVHLLRIEVDERPGADLGSLVEASLERPRSRVVGDLARLEVAGRALRWVRRASPPQTPEPALWAEVNGLLDRLDGPGELGSPEALLAAAGLRMLSAVGWGLDLERCVRCGRACGAEASACVDPAAGGLVCRVCGGAPRVLRADRRLRLLAAAGGDDAALLEEDASLAMDLVDAALAAHSGQGGEG